MISSLTGPFQSDFCLFGEGATRGALSDGPVLGLSSSRDRLLPDCGVSGAAGTGVGVTGVGPAVGSFDVGAILGLGFGCLFGDFGVRGDGALGIGLTADATGVGVLTGRGERPGMLDTELLRRLGGGCCSVIGGIEFGICRPPGAMGIGEGPGPRLGPELFDETTGIPVLRLPGMAIDLNVSQNLKRKPSIPFSVSVWTMNLGGD